MKNSKFLKLISLALTVALLVAVAIPTLTTSAEDTTPEYVKSITIDFEDDEVGQKSTHATGGKVAEEGGNKFLVIPTAGNMTDYGFLGTYMKAGRYYEVSFEYYIKTANGSIWTAPEFVSVNNGVAATISKIPSISASAVFTEWKYYSCSVIVAQDSYFGIVGDDEICIDNVTVVDITDVINPSVYMANDGVANLANELALKYERSGKTVEYVEDATYGTVASFVLTTTKHGNGVTLPVAFEVGKKYKIEYDYSLDAEDGTDANPRWHFLASTSSFSSGNIKDKQITSSNPGAENTWYKKSFEYTPTTSSAGFTFRGNRTGGCKIYFKVANLSITEIKTENTATKQTYTFDTHDFSEYSSSESQNYTLKTVERDNKLTMALRGNCTDSAVTQICAKFDAPLTTGKYYRLSYDVKGKGNIAITMTNGGWGKSQYKTEAFGETQQGWTIDTASWKPHSTVFCAKYDSTHMYIRVSSGTEVYFDNITIEEYTPFKQEIDTYDTGYEKRGAYFEIVDDPVADNAGNKVIKCIPSGSNSYLSISSARFVPQHTYEVTFKYYGTGWFRPDIASASFTVGGHIKAYNGITSSQTWKTARYIITATDAMNMASFGMLCKENVYFDDFTITDISNFDANDETLDYGSDNGAFVSQASYATVTKEVDDRDETKKVTKITFTSSSTYDNSRMSIPFSLQKDKTYVIKITYKSNTFVAISWDDKALGVAGLDPSSEWTTATRYAKGTTGDMPLFAVPKTDTGTELYIADITITEVDETGGLNGDGVIDAKDYSIFRGRFFTGKRDDTTHFNKYADQNGDSTVDVLDMVLLSKIGK